MNANPISSGIWALQFSSSFTLLFCLLFVHSLFPTLCQLEYVVFVPVPLISYIQFFSRIVCMEFLFIIIQKSFLKINKHLYLDDPCSQNIYKLRY